MLLTLARPGSEAAHDHALRTWAGSPVRSSAADMTHLPTQRGPETMSRMSPGIFSSSTPRTAISHSISRASRATPRMDEAVGCPKSTTSTGATLVSVRTRSRVAIRGSAAT